MSAVTAFVGGRGRGGLPGPETQPPGGLFSPALSDLLRLPPEAPAFTFWAIQLESGGIRRRSLT